MCMSLFNTAKHYNVYLDIPDTIDFSWNAISANDIFDIDSFLTQLIIKDERSLIVLWGVDHRISIDDVRFLKLNEFYHGINNPMILFNGIDVTNGYLDFPTKQINFFMHLSKEKSVQGYQTATRNKKFLYCGTKDYLSRRYLLKTLIDHSSEGHIAYKCVNQDLSNRDYSEHDHSIILDRVSTTDGLIPIQGFDSSIEFTEIPKNIIDDCHVSIITETYFDGPVYFSEKIFNAMMYNHIFIYLGPANSLSHLRQLGFRTWNHILDEGYDSIVDPAQRLYAVDNVINNFLSKPINEIKELYANNLDILEHNRRIISETDITNSVVSGMEHAISLKRGLL